MEKVIHGELRLDGKMMGQAGDLFCILLTAGYTIETRIKKDAFNQNGEIIFTIMKED